jgi:hypothetical protein
MVAAGGQVEWERVFPFLEHKPSARRAESLLWSRYVELHESICLFGRKWVSTTNERKRASGRIDDLQEYHGYGTALVGPIRNQRFNSGGQFVVEHRPEPDIPGHCEVELRLGGGGDEARNRRNEMKLWLYRHFFGDNGDRYVLATGSAEPPTTILR